MANGEWRMAEHRTQESEVRSQISDLWTLISDARFLRTFFLAWLIMATFLLSAVLAVEGDVVFKRPGGAAGVAATVFPHWIHRIRYKCYACHPDPFEMKAGANKVTMEAISEGKFCGACHNGRIAWGVTFETCNSCHM